MRLSLIAIDVIREIDSRGLNLPPCLAERRASLALPQTGSGDWSRLSSMRVL